MALRIFADKPPVNLKCESAEILWIPPQNYFDTSTDQQSAQLQQVSEIWSHDHPVEQKEQKDGASEDCPPGDTFGRTQKMFYLFCQRTTTALWASGQQCVCGIDNCWFEERDNMQWDAQIVCPEKNNLTMMKVSRKSNPAMQSFMVWWKMLVGIYDAD